MKPSLLCNAGITILAFAATFAWGADVSQKKTVGGIDVFYGVVPAQVVQGHIDGHGAARMNKNGFFARGTHHLVVSLYDAKTTQRITDAQVSAKVTPLGRTPETRNLVAMKINDTVSYGNNFSMPPDDLPYIIALSIKRPAEHVPVTAEFEYKHAESR